MSSPATSPENYTARVLTIAGSDSGGGAGIQADLKTFFAHRCYGASVLTALTAQNTLGVQGVHAVPPAFVRAQLDSVLSDIGCDAAKTGMLFSAEIISEVAGAMRDHAVDRLVVDPVMVSKSGHRLLAPEAVAAMREVLFPLAMLVTPNIEEAGDLLGARPTSIDEMIAAAKALHALGPRAVLIKGGHLGATATHSNDVLFDGHNSHILEGPRLDAKHTHGTGCTLSAAIAARLALGHDVVAAAHGAKEWLTMALRAAQPLGGGIGPVNHGWEFSTE